MMKNIHTPGGRSKSIGVEVFNIPNTEFQAALTEVDDTTNVIADSDGMVYTSGVPGYPGETYVRWGDDDLLPFRLINLVGADEVTAQNKLFNVLTCYGAGPRLEVHADKPPHYLPEAKRWVNRQFLPRYFLEQATDMKHFYLSVCVIIMSRDGKRINRLIHKDACYCRFAKADNRGRINYVYYGNWQARGIQEGKVERIPLLSEDDPFGDLCSRMGYDPEQPERAPRPTRAGRKFAMLVRFPTAGCQYYPVPYWTAVFRGGSYDEKRLISVGKRAKLRNSSSIKYQVEIERTYWDRICAEENINDPVEMQKRVNEEKQKIKDFVCGIENSGKAWISGYYVNPDGHEVHDIHIVQIATPKEGGDWMEDVQAASNTICYADNVHPNLVGATPGKSQSNNSGSDKRELFTMKQALETAFHHLLLMPLNMVCRYNGWEDAEFTVPMIQLTTLDEHRDAKQVTTENHNL